MYSKRVGSVELDLNTEVPFSGFCPALKGGSHDVFIFISSHHPAFMQLRVTAIGTELLHHEEENHVVVVVLTLSVVLSDPCQA